MAPTCPPPQKDNFPEFDDKESEARFKDAMKGETDKSATTRFKEAFDASYRNMTRKFPAMEETAFSADFMEGLRKVETAEEMAKDDIVKMFGSVMGGLNKKQQEFMTRAVVIKDLYWTATQGMKLPYGFKGKKDVEQELAKVEAVLAANPALQQRLDAREDFLNQIREDLVNAGVLGEHEVNNEDYFRHKVLEYHGLRKLGGAPMQSKTKMERGKWAPRTGSEKDISANYLEVESEVLLKSRQDIAVNKFIDGALKEYDKFPAYSETARKHNDAVAKRKFALEISDVLDKLPQKVVGDFEIVAAMAGEKETSVAAVVREYGKARKRLRGMAPKAEKEEFLEWVAVEIDRNMPHLTRMNEYRIEVGSAFNLIRTSLLKVSKQDFERLPGDVQDAVQSAYLATNEEEFRDAMNSFNMMEFAKWSLKTDFEPTAGPAGRLMSVLGLRRNYFAEELVADEFINPREAQALIEAYGAPEDAIWQPDAPDGNTRAMYMFNAKTVPERVMDVVSAELAAWSADEIAHPDAAVLEMILTNVREMLVQGGPKQEMIIPTDMAVTLNTFRDPVLEQGVLRLARTVTTGWKQYVLMAPQQAPKYIMNNITSDLEAIITSRPRILAWLWTASNMLRTYGKTGVVSEELHEALERGVIHSALTMQEIQAMNQYKFEDDGRITAAGLESKFLKWPKKYFNAMRNLVLWRENTVRLAAYLYYRKVFVEQGKTPEDHGMDATKPWYAAGITDPKDLAARYARDIMGDYGNVSRGGRRMAAIGVPFWRWAESNMRRYVNRIRNVYLTYKYDSKMKGVGYGVMHASLMAAHIMSFQIAVYAYNWVFQGDEEEDLSEKQKLHPHITLGRTADGNVRLLNYMGALTDFGAWFGFEEAMAVHNEVLKGRASPVELLTAIAKAPVNRFTQGLNPLFTTPIQLGLGREFYPDIFNPRAMRDPWQFTVRALSLGGYYPELMKAAGGAAAGREWEQRVAKILINQIHPGEAAYLEIQSKGYGYVKRVLKKPADFGVGGREGRLRYEFRRALRMGDEAAAHTLFHQLSDDYEMTYKDLGNMLDAMKPLQMMNRQDRRNFLDTLDKNEMAKYEKALDFYHEMRDRAYSAEYGPEE